MTAIRIQVTAEDCSVAGPWPRPPAVLPPGWKSPVELAIARVAGVDVDLDYDEQVWMVTIGTTSHPGATLVVSLAGEVNDLLDFYWQGGPGGLMVPFEFDLIVDDWLPLFLATPADMVTLVEAGRVLGLKAQTLRGAAQSLRDGAASDTALAGRLGMVRIGRDWFIPRHRLLAEVARRDAARE